jgi:hypothetical protein
MLPRNPADRPNPTEGAIRRPCVGLFDFKYDGFWALCYLTPCSAELLEEATPRRTHHAIGDRRLSKSEL